MDNEISLKESNLSASGYNEPNWSGICSEGEYSLDVLKDGVIIDNIKLYDKPYYIIGRFKTCDLVFEHPSLSRFHAVLQFCATENSEGKEKGWYIMDLDSTHGSVINKNKIKALTFTRIRTGYVIKLGGSSRLYIVNGPDEDKDPISKHSWTELNEMKEKAKLASTINDDTIQTGGCMWGMDNDSGDDESCFTNPENVQKYPNEKLYKEDPKKVIKWFFDREGLDEGPLYNFSNNGFNKSTCILELPVFGENGHRVIAEVTGSDKKKDMVEKCALQACYILDEMNELYKSGGSSIVPRKDLNYYKDKDYYSSEEDEFYDRTGDLEEKRLQRMRRFGVIEDTRDVKEKKLAAKDVDSPLIKLQRLEEINNEILSIEEKLEDAKKAMEADKGASEMDEIEKYLEAIQSGTLNRQARLKLKARVFELQREENLLRKQLKLTIPVTESMRKTLFGDKDQTKKKEEVPETSTKKVTDDHMTDCDQKLTNSHCEVRGPKMCKISIEEEFGEEEVSTVKTGVVIVEETGEKKVDTKRKSSASISSEKKVYKKTTTSLTEEDVTDWLPPRDQSGDGRTSLNDHLGY